MPNGAVKIVEYNPIWPSLFQREKKRLMDTCGQHIIAIEHIGSTAVPGLGSKDIIDLMVAVTSIEIADELLIKKIIGMGYKYSKHLEEFFPERRYFSTVPGEMEYHCHIHMVELDTVFWRKHSIFRDYLREFPDVRDAYNDLKINLSKIHNTEDTRVQYTDNKTNFIEDVVKKAKKYYNVEL